MKVWNITMPFAGSVIFQVEAENEAEAREKALQADAHIDLKVGGERADIQEWTFLEAYHEGNVCYCPHPWEMEVEIDGDAS